MQDSLINPQERERLESIRKEKKEVYQKIELLNSELKDITNKLDILCIPRDDQDPVLFRKKNAIKMFKSNPKSAIEFLTVHGIIDGSPESVARILIEENDSLCKTTVGNYIGEVSKDFNLEVLDNFVQLQNFANFEFIDALRALLATFNIPGEAQKIDKILKTFGKVYHDQNPNVFATEDDAYVLAFAAIMLNTTLHNANVKAQQNPLAEENFFVQTMMNYDETTHLSEDLARKTFTSIKAKPILPNQGGQITLGSLQYGQSILKGFLFKMSGPVKTWKKRWFVLTDTSLLCFINSDQKESQSKGVINLENAQVNLVTNDRSKEFAFNIIPNSQPSPTSPPLPNQNSPKNHSNIGSGSIQALFSDTNNNSGFNNQSNLNSRSDHHNHHSNPFQSSNTTVNSCNSNNNHSNHHNQPPNNNHSNQNQLWRLAASTQEDRDLWYNQLLSVIDSLRANRTCFEIFNQKNTHVPTTASSAPSSNGSALHQNLPLSTNIFDSYGSADGSQNDEVICPSAVNTGLLKNNLTSPIFNGTKRHPPAPTEK